jgi:hypothetical protein
LLLQHGGIRLEPRTFMRVIRRDDGARGLMGKIQKGHGTVEDASGFLERNRERVTTLHKKRESSSPFPGTFKNPRNLLRQAFREQDEIGWSGIFKGRIAMQWKVYTAQHMNAKEVKLKMQEWAPKLINAMWDHTTRLWHYHNDAIHSRYTKQVAQLNIDTLEREHE